MVHSQRRWYKYSLLPEEVLDIPWDLLRCGGLESEVDLLRRGHGLVGENPQRSEMSYPKATSKGGKSTSIYYTNGRRRGGHPLVTGRPEVPEGPDVR